MFFLFCVFFCMRCLYDCARMFVCFVVNDRFFHHVCSSALLLVVRSRSDTQTSRAGRSEVCKDQGVQAAQLVSIRMRFHDSQRKALYVCVCGCVHATRATEGTDSITWFHKERAHMTQTDRQTDGQTECERGSSVSRLVRNCRVGHTREREEKFVNAPPTPSHQYGIPSP